MKIKVQLNYIVLYREREEQIRNNGIQLPSQHKELRTDSGKMEEDAIFATIQNGWKDRIKIEFEIPIDNVYIRTTYCDQAGKRVKLPLKGFLNMCFKYNKVPLDLNRAEFLITKEILPDQFLN